MEKEQSASPYRFNISFISDFSVVALVERIRCQVASPRFGAVSNDFKGALNDKGALFAAYIACRHNGLRDLFTDSQILLQKNVDRHHILPRAQFEESRRPKADTIANIAFITGEANRLIGAASPDVYLKKLKRETLVSQCIPLDQSLWRIERAEEFWEARRKLLATAFNGFLRKMLPSRRIVSE